MHMAKFCVFNRKECDAKDIGDIKRCCEEIGSNVHPQVLVEAYTKSLKPDAPVGVAVALLATIHNVEESSGLRLL